MDKDGPRLVERQIRLARGGPGWFRVQHGGPDECQGKLGWNRMVQRRAMVDLVDSIRLGGLEKEWG